MTQIVDRPNIWDGFSIKALEIQMDGVATAPTLSAAALSPATVTGGQNSTLTVTLTNPAPAGGSVVALTSNAPTVPVPASVTVPEGLSSVTLNVVRVQATVSRDRWYPGWLTFSGPVTASTPKPVFTLSNGVQVRLPAQMPIGRSTYAFTYSTSQNGTISVSLGGVTRSATLTLR